jgi:hypothetical protein
MGAMQLVAESYSPEQLDTVGLALYVSWRRRTRTDAPKNDFKPDVVNWGQRGSVSIAKILEQIKTPVDKQPEGATGSASEETPAEETEKKETSEPMTPKKMEVPATPRKIEVSPPAKRAKLDTDGMSLEEYEAMLDVDFEEGLYDFY